MSEENGVAFGEIEKRIEEIDGLMGQLNKITGKELFIIKLQEQKNDLTIACERFRVAEVGRSVMMHQFSGGGESSSHPLDDTPAPGRKTLHNSTISDALENVKDIVVVGDGDMFQLLCKASSEKEGWMKSTKAMQIPGVGCLVQVTTQQRNPDRSYAVAEALTFVPTARIVEGENNVRTLESVSAPAKTGGMPLPGSILTPGKSIGESIGESHSCSE